MSKDKGWTAELAFVTRCDEMNLTVSQPFADNSPYDFITDANGVLKRVQVKGVFTKQEDKDCYKFTAARNDGSIYKAEEVDLIAAFVPDHNSWYIIPVSKLRAAGVRLYPHRDNPAGFYEEFTENWSALYD